MPRKQVGKFVIRTPKKLHRDLARMAKTEGVSVNHLVTYLLSVDAEMRLAPKRMACGCLEEKCE